MKHYVIYQADTNKSTGSKILFRSLESIKKEGIALTFDAYKKVYEGDFEANDENELPITEQLYIMFNLSHPKDFYGHSLSVSDIIVIDGQRYFCDSIGFKPISINFTGSEVSSDNSSF